MRANTRNRFGARMLSRAIVAAVTAALLGCGGTADTFLSPVVGSGGGTGTGGGSTDTTAPTVASTSPANGSTSVPTTANITVNFSENVDSASVTNASFTVSPGVTGTIRVSGATATLTPSPSLPSSTLVTVTLGGGIRDRAGNALASTSFSFTTAP